MANPTASNLVGTTLAGRYRIVRQLGEGGMGAVYEAEHTFTRGRQAVKVLSPQGPLGEQEVLRFIQEAQAASRVQHPNIVTVFDGGYDPDARVYFIAQELLHGRSLRDFVHEHPNGVAPLTVKELALPLMEALMAAHAAGVVHRDLKPENVFLCDTAEGVRPKIIDFGIAKVGDEGERLLETTAGMVLGTLLYMSPEQVRGEAHLADARSDIWSLGVMLYELLAGRVPFYVENRTMLGIKILQEPAAPLTRVAPQVPAGWWPVVDRALQKEPAARYPTMRAFLEAVRQCPVDAWGDDLTSQHSVPELDAPTVPSLGSMVPSQLAPSVTLASPVGAAAMRPATDMSFERPAAAAPVSRKKVGALAALAALACALTVAAWMRRPTPDLDAARPTHAPTVTDAQAVTARAPDAAVEAPTVVTDTAPVETPAVVTDAAPVETPAVVTDAAPVEATPHTTPRVPVIRTPRQHGHAHDPFLIQ